jgi:hypothetical protein
MSEIQTTNWDSTAASNNATPPDGWPEGQAPSTINDCAREMMAAVKRWFTRDMGLTDAGVLVASAGTSTVITVAYDVAPASLYTGLECSFKVTTTNGATPTLNVNSLGAKNIQKWTGAAYADIAANDIVAGQHVKVKYDGTLDKWVLLGNTAGHQVYLEGTFTPAMAFGGGTTGITYTTQTGAYTRIGRLVHVEINIQLSNKGSSTGSATITGLPLTVGGNTALTVFISNMTSGVGDTYVEGIFNASATTMSLFDIGSGAAAALTDVDFANNSVIRVAGTYRV